MKNIISRALSGGGVTVTLLLFTLSANAQNITYQIDRAFDGVTVVGTIETNGHIGSIDPHQHIMSWSFDIDDGSEAHPPVTIGSSLGGGLTGAGWEFLTATATELVFDYDGAYQKSLDTDSFQDVQFFGGGNDFSFNYGFASSAELGWRKEQLAHFFPDGSHYGEALRSGADVVGRVDSPAMDCSGRSVSLGEAMSGLQSGLTGGAHTEVGAPGGYFLTAGGEDRRGFIVPEAIGVSQQCENDYILVSGWQGCQVGGVNDRTMREAMECATDIDGRILDHYFEIDGVRVDYMQTKARVGTSPDTGNQIGSITTGVILEPYSLEPGSHTAHIVYTWDSNRDGVPDFDFQFFTEFTIHQADETP
jgi:hypothetical protein